jgi:hypothetical protein
MRGLGTTSGREMVILQSMQRVHSGKTVSRCVWLHDTPANAITQRLQVKLRFHFEAAV